MVLSSPGPAVAPRVSRRRWQAPARDSAESLSNSTPTQDSSLSHGVLSGLPCCIDVSSSRQLQEQVVALTRHVICSTDGNQCPTDIHISVHTVVWEIVSFRPESLVSTSLVPYYSIPVNSGYANLAYSTGRLAGRRVGYCPLWVCPLSKPDALFWRQQGLFNPQASIFVPWGPSGHSTLHVARPDRLGSTIRNPLSIGLLLTSSTEASATLTQVTV